MLLLIRSDYILQHDYNDYRPYLEYLFCIQMYNLLLFKSKNDDTFTYAIVIIEKRLALLKKETLTELLIRY